MCTKTDGAEYRIVLSSVVLKHLHQLPASALKIYVYLCSRDKGQPTTASIRIICNATGVHKRTAVSAIERLLKCTLITRNRGIGRGANEYQILFAASSPASSAELQARDEPEPEIPRSAHEGSTAAPPMEPKAMLSKLITCCYRPLNAVEFARLMTLFPDATILMERLKSLYRQGGVVPDQSLEFLATVLTYQCG